MAEARSRALAAGRRILPWAVGAAILVVVVLRVPFEAFRAAIGHGPHVTLATVDFVVVVVTLGTDSVATWLGLLALRLRRPLAHVAAVRGATFVLFLLNYALGQGGFGYYLHRTGTPARRAVGATLFLIGTNLATLLLVTSIACAAHGDDASMGWFLPAGCAALAAYLVVIGIAPDFVRRRAVFAPLFDAGLRGHAIAMASRLPHVLVMSLGIWWAMRAWGIEVPFVAGLTTMPIVVIAAALPIAPAGLGTTQAALVYLFSDFATGATADERNAVVLAFSIVHFVYSVLGILVVGLVCIPVARNLGAIASPQLPPTKSQ